ncbi:MFS general substrate transporter [Apiospora rasikravindrae]|uniref:MFS general substrate transporter n=1 Tax=Apiospora rasikravindrae TaxID=990691 RepID=A0ABR1S2S4_9PEZI
MVDATRAPSLVEKSQQTLAGDRTSAETLPTHKVKEQAPLPIPTAATDRGLDVERFSISESDSFDVRWDGGDSDPLNPRSLSSLRKWLIFAVVSVSALCVTFTSSVYTSTLGQITQEFGVSNIVGTLGLSLFIIGLAVGPMLLGPLSEFYGRRPIYLVSLTFFLIWLVPEAVAKNIATMLVGRFLCGVSGSAFLAVAGGTAGDLFSREQLTAPMVVFTATGFVGPSVGPVIGGFINEFASWRWTFYVLIIWAAVNLLLLVLLVPETYHPVLLRNKARRLRADTGDSRWIAPIERMSKSIPVTIATATRRPFELLIFEPMCLCLCILAALLLGIVYLFFGAFGVVFRGNYGFNLWQLGLAFLGLFVGMLLGAACTPIVQWNYTRLVKRKEAETGEIGGSEPEFRLPPAVVGSVLVPIGLFMFAWTCFPNVHWIVPIVGSGIFGMGCLLVFTGIFTFQVEAYPLYAASALAANTFLRCIFGAAFPLFGIQMYRSATIGPPAS